MSAISKLSRLDQFDKNGLLKPELVLDSAEKEALMCYIPETTETFNKFSENNQQEKSFEQRYSEFLIDVRINTIKLALKQKMPEEKSMTIPWQIMGIEFTSWKIDEQYGKDVYEKANKEVPYEEVTYRIYNRDFSRANIKLGHLVYEGLPASPLLDLDIFIKSLEIIGISSYIDYENNVFYYNAVAQKSKTK